VKLHFLGTTGYHANNERQTACLMLPEIGVILDAGTGIFRARDLIETDALDIFLTHAHLDHCIGLTFLFDVLCEKDVQRVTVHLADDKVSAIRDHLFHPLLFPVQPEFELKLFGGNPIKLRDGSKLKTIELEHPGGCHGFRIDWANHSMAYITDTVASPTAPYVDALRGVNTLVHECYFPDGWQDKAELTGHSCLTPVAQAARKAGVDRLFLVHLNPLDEALEQFDLSKVKHIFADVQFARDHQVIDV
jgi:ribonuclease BN (tRNA processing enzyme)